MGERTSHRAGTLSWADLSTSDLDAAKAFYGALLGWEFEDTPVGGGIVYAMARVGALDVAAASVVSEPGEPPRWNVYVTVDSADAAAARAAELGATVVAEPFDVFDSGRMAVLQDPSGAIFAAWEPRRHIGANLVNAPGALTWADLTTTDVDAAARFYGDWVGWTAEELPGGEGYRVIRNGDRTNGGMQPLSPELAATVPPHWYPYFGTADLDAASARVTELGGSVVVEPTPVAGLDGAFAIVADPQGASFALWGGAYDD